MASFKTYYAWTTISGAVRSKHSHVNRLF